MLERLLAILASSALVLAAGCFGGDAPAPTTSSSAPKEYRVLTGVDKEINGCAPSGSPYPSAPTVVPFEVPEGYDTLVISFHETGVGQRRVWIANNEAQNSPIWERPQANVNTLPNQCGSHAHSGDAETKTVEPGNYTARISYSGTISMHLSVLVKSSKANATANATHSHPTTKAA